jgi:hypothetical protein
MDSRQAAEAAFKKATTKPLEPVARQPSIPNAKELVSASIGMFSNTSKNPVLAGRIGSTKH